MSKIRRVLPLVAIALIVFTTLAFASLTVVYVFWESARLAVLGGLALLYSGALVAIIVSFRRYVARQPKPFAATLQEITEDRACIRKPN